MLHWLGGMCVVHLETVGGSPQSVVLVPPLVLVLLQHLPGLVTRVATPAGGSQVALHLPMVLLGGV